MVGQIFLRHKNWVFSAVITLVFLVFMDLIVGFLLVFYIKPIEIEKVVQFPANVLPHPYKAYTPKAGQEAWKTGIDIQNLAGMELDYGVVPQGTVSNLFGHMVLPEDIEIHKKKKSNGEFRILFLGGSTTYQPWPFLLESALSRKFANVNFKIINAGAGGYTSQENLADLIFSGFIYEPDLVVAYLPINDIYQAAQYPNYRRDYLHCRTPMQTFVQNAPEKPEEEIRVYPFGAKLYDTLLYNQEISEYLNQMNLGYHIQPQPQPWSVGHLIDPDSFDKTVSGVIDNIYNMDLLCKARGIDFCLILQKVFPADNPYYNIIGQDSQWTKFCVDADIHTIEACHRIGEDNKMANIKILKMNDVFPNHWTEQAKKQVTQNFSDKKINMEQPLSYDAMHFTPGGLYLFASIVSDYLKDEHNIHLH
jgi:hypothetical protein